MLKTQVIVLASAILLLGVVLDLVRRRHLREEYSWLWLAAALFYLVTAIKPNLLRVISDFLGITNPITAFTFFGLLFIVLILIHYSVRLSNLTTQLKNVAQMIAILDGDQTKINDFFEGVVERERHTEARQDSEKNIDEPQQADILKIESAS